MHLYLKLYDLNPFGWDLFDICHVKNDKMRRGSEIIENIDKTLFTFTFFTDFEEQIEYFEIKKLVLSKTSVVYAFKK